MTMIVLIELMWSGYVSVQETKRVVRILTSNVPHCMDSLGKGRGKETLWKTRYNNTSEDITSQDDMILSFAVKRNLLILETH